MKPKCRCARGAPVLICGPTVGGVQAAAISTQAATTISALVPIIRPEAASGFIGWLAVRPSYNRRASLSFGSSAALAAGPRTSQ